MRRSNALTKKQRELYEILKDFTEKEGKSPTLSELCTISGKCKNTIWSLLRNIEEKGYIKIENYKKRGIILEENLYDKYIYICENDIKKETHD